MLSAVIPTYQRERILVDTIHALLALNPAPSEVIVVDQTARHDAEVAEALQGLHKGGQINWIRLTSPSITHAMNVGLQTARFPVVLFLDDDIVPGARLISSHVALHAERKAKIIAGQVLQPGEVAMSPNATREFRFNSDSPTWVEEVIGCNFSVDREFALWLGGFDENFVHVAYRFEAEFCSRARSVGERIYFEPQASIRHLKAASGGTRSFGHHLTTVRPSHAVGAYYCLLRTQTGHRRWMGAVERMFRSVRTRHHARHPWWIPGTLLSEVLGLLWALKLSSSGPRLVHSLVGPPVHD